MQITKCNLQIFIEKHNTMLQDSHKNLLRETMF